MTDALVAAALQSLNSAEWTLLWSWFRVQSRDRHHYKERAKMKTEEIFSWLTAYLLSVLDGWSKLLCLINSDYFFLDLYVAIRLMTRISSAQKHLPFTSIVGTNSLKNYHREAMKRSLPERALKAAGKRNCRSPVVVIKIKLFRGNIIAAESNL